MQRCCHAPAKSGVGVGVLGSRRGSPLRPGPFFMRGGVPAIIKLANILENRSELTPASPGPAFMVPDVRGGAPDGPYLSIRTGESMTSPTHDGRSLTREILSKVPAVTLTFWIIKVAATTLGETGGDAVTMS